MVKLYEIELELIESAERTTIELEAYLRHLLSECDINLLNVKESERKLKNW